MATKKDTGWIELPKNLNLHFDNYMHRVNALFKRETPEQWIPTILRIEILEGEEGKSHEYDGS